MMEERGGRPLLLVDLAVPRDIDPACAASGRRDAARHGRAAGAGARAPERAARRGRAAEAIVEDEIQSFAGWLGRLEVLPTLTALRERGDAIVDGLLAENAGRWESLSERDARARRGAGARGRQAAAARADRRGCATSTPSTATRGSALLRELFGLEEAAAADADEAAEVRRLHG